MSRTFLALAGALVLAVGAYSLIPISDEPQAVETVSTSHLPTPSTPVPAPKQSYGADRMSQSYGTICETPRGECTVSPKPINNLCSCNGTPGKIIR